MTESKPMSLAEKVLSHTSAIRLLDAKPEEASALAANLRLAQRWNACALLVVLALLIAAYGPQAFEKARKGFGSWTNPPAEKASPRQNPLDAAAISSYFHTHKAHFRNQGVHCCDVRHTSPTRT